MKTIYLDNAASTRPDPEVVLAMRDVLEERWGNPSSLHAVGSAAKMKLEEARGKIASLLSCHADEIYFTSGGTEADNWAVMGSLSEKRNHLVTVATEHHAIMDMTEWCLEHGFECTVLPVDSEGRVDPDDVRKAITPRTALVSVMHVNNETGTIQDIEEIGRICKEAGVLFHSDCVQSFGKMPLNFGKLHADMISISGHKINGPKGIGALVIRRGTRIANRTIGGSQERGLRPGTENIAGIVGFGQAAEICKRVMPTEMQRIGELRDHLESRILTEIPDVQVNGSREHRSPTPTNVSFVGCDGEALLIALDMRGFCVSTGSACSAGAVGASHVLLSLGLPMDVARASLRISFGRYNTMSDVEQLMEILPGLVSKQRQSAFVTP